MFLYLILQGRRNAGTQPSDQLQNGVAELPFTFCLLVCGWLATMAPQDIFREKEAHLDIRMTFSIFFLIFVSYVELDSMLKRTKQEITLQNPFGIPR